MADEVEELAAQVAQGRYGLPGAGFSLDGRRVVVTGASRNIGLSMAVAFAQAGADVLMVARGAERLSVAAGAVGAAHPDRLIAQACADVGTAEGVAAVAAAVEEHLGAADVLVNNAAATGREGIEPGTPALHLPDESFESTYRVNVLGPYRLTRELFDGRGADEGDACVINVVSGSGLQPVPEPRSVAYGASKSALWMMTRYLAHHLAPRVRVNAVCPGAVTPDGEPLSDLQARLLDVIPMGRIGRAAEIAGAAVYLASDAASYTTGELLICNGGRPW